MVLESMHNAIDRLECHYRDCFGIIELLGRAQVDDIACISEFKPYSLLKASVAGRFDSLKGQSVAGVAVEIAVPGYLGTWLTDRVG